MPLICYQPKRFDTMTLATIEQANRILKDYAKQGYDLTLRQLYYQFVARGIITNKDTEYKRLGSIVNDARLAGLIDWSSITDRTRNMKQNGHWESPQSIIETCGKQYQIDKWASQENYVEVWVEKDALVGLLEVACKPLDVPYFSCRGYTSQSEVWAASQRFLEKIRAGKRLIIIHLGDHDPSGIDMTRDITDRMTLFLTHHGIRDMVKANPKLKGETPVDFEARVRPILESSRVCSDPIEVHRIALNMDQIEQYNPPPNPAKLTDARARGYIDRFGGESWELDALEPSVITTLIRETVEGLRDFDQWEQAVEREDDEKAKLAACADQWDQIARRL